MDWHADLNRSITFVAISLETQLLDVATAGRYRGPDGLGRLARSVSVGVFALPVATYFVSLNHEWGHAFRAREKSVPVWIRIVGSPWSRAQFELTSDPSVYPRVGGTDGLFDLGIESGGLEASRVLKDRIEFDGSSNGVLTVSDTIAAIMASIETPIYAAANLRPGSYEVVGSGSEGDLVRYAYQFTLDRLRSRPDVSTPVDEQFRQLKHRALINLIDTSLWSHAVGLIVDHIWKGESAIRLRSVSIGRAHLLPSMRYAFTAEGPELSVRSIVMMGQSVSRLYVRWLDRPASGPSIGWGAAYSRRRAGVAPSFLFDYWGGTGQAGVRVELGANMESTTLKRWRIASCRVAVGAKRAGYVQGLPLGRDVYSGLTCYVAFR